MPLNAHPPTCDGAAFALKRAAMERAAVVDFALWGGLVPGNLGDLQELARRGVVGFKAFMCASGIDDFQAADERTLREGMAQASALGLPVAVHAESDAITAGLAARAVAAGRRAMRDYLDSRPAIAETEAIARAIHLATETGAPLHVVHVSTGRGAVLVAEARARGVDVTCETCPHYLALTGEDAERLGAVAKCAPPLRPPDEREALWEGLRAGRIGMVASDHSPAPPELKRDDDAFASWGGIMGCQTLYAVVLGEGLERGLTPAGVAGLVATAPARRFRLAGKGALAVGADADLALVDPRAAGPLHADELRYRHRTSPFVGRDLGCRVVRTLLRGEEVGADGPPRGRLVRPAAP
jgi:allantoinase